MKLWRKYVLAAGCVLCMSILAGCGNNDKETEQAKETTRMEETDETVGTDMNDTENDNLPDNGNDVTEGDGRDGSVNGVTDKDADNNRDSSNVGDAGDELIDGAGNAGKDVIDGVGDAGKDIIDGVEDAGDALTGQETERETDRP